MIKKFTLILLGIFCIADAMAQRRVFGTVTDTNNTPLSGATVVVKELSNLGAVANVDGHYELRLPDNKNYTIIATYIGYIDESKTSMKYITEH